MRRFPGDGKSILDPEGLRDTGSGSKPMDKALRHAWPAGVGEVELGGRVRPADAQASSDVLALEDDALHLIRGPIVAAIAELDLRLRELPGAVEDELHHVPAVEHLQDRDERRP